MDVTDAATVAGLPASLPEAWREIDVLVNNAGLARGIKPAQQSEIADVGHDRWRPTSPD